jgi:hypothetical protein
MLSFLVGGEMIDLKKFKYNIYAFIKISIYKTFLNTFYEFQNIKNSEIIIHHHSGLGDAIICNGIVNYLSEKFDKIYLAAHSKISNHLYYLYSENDSVELLIYDDAKEIYKNKKIPVLRIGFEKNNKNFNTSFYEQIGLDYQISFDYFYIPTDQKKETNLQNHLINEYKVTNQFGLIHQVSSYGKVDLNIKNKSNYIFVEKETDIYKNIFFYKKVIENAVEIHCIDSSFLHLVERVPTSAKLYFHNNKTKTQQSEKLFLSKNWETIK